MPEEMKSPKGKLAYAHVDCPDDRWAWCIVTEYNNHPQDYGNILMGFMDGFEPSSELVKQMLEDLERRLYP